MAKKKTKKKIKTKRLKTAALEEFLFGKPLKPKRAVRPKATKFDPKKFGALLQARKKATAERIERTRARRMGEI